MRPYATAWNMNIPAANQQPLPYSFGSLAFPQDHLLCYLTLSLITLCEQAVNLRFMTNWRLILRPAFYMFELNILRA